MGVEAGSVGEDDVAWLLPFGKVVFVGVAGFLTRSTRWKVKNATARKATTPRKIFRLRLRGFFVVSAELWIKSFPMQQDPFEVACIRIVSE